MTGDSDSGDSDSADFVDPVVDKTWLQISTRAINRARSAVPQILQADRLPKGYWDGVDLGVASAITETLLFLDERGVDLSPVTRR